MILFHLFQVKLRFKSWLLWKEEYKENPVEQGKESTTGLTEIGPRLKPSAPSLPFKSFANSNLKGVKVSSGTGDK